MFTLRIYLMGLVALVRRDGGRKLDIVLPIAGGTGHDQHVPILLYPYADEETTPSGDIPSIAGALGVAGNVHEGRLACLGPQGQVLQEFGGMLLNGESISVKGAISGSVQLADPVGRPSGTDVEPNNPSEREGLAWVPRLAEVAGTDLVLKEGVLANPGKNHVSATMSLNELQGRLFSYHLAMMCEGNVPKIFHLEFKDPAKPTQPPLPFSHPATDICVLDLKVSGDEVTLKTSPFADAGIQSRSVKLRGNDGQTLEILLGNPPPVYGTAQFCKKVGGVGNHFNFLYELLDQPPPFKRRPYKKATHVAPDDLNPRYMPPVIKVITFPQCNAVNAGFNGRDDGGINRPICTLTLIDAE